MSILWVIVVVLVIAMIIGAPTVGLWHHGYGWGPSGGIGLILLILLVLFLLGRL